MASNPGTSGFVTSCRQSMSKVIEAAVEVGGLYALASVVCEMEFSPKDGWVPVMNENGEFSMKVTDDELKEMGHTITAQQLGRTFFGMAFIMSAIKSSLSDEIITTRM